MLAYGDAEQQRIRRRQIVQQKRLDVLIVLFTLFAAAMMTSLEMSGLQIERPIQACLSNAMHIL